ncbi:MAG: glycosyltransferase [Candidatus Paceibacterota bacterium]
MKGFGVKERIDDFQNKKYGFRVDFLRKIQSFVVRNASFVVTPSDYFKKVVWGWGVKENKIQRIYNGVSIPDILESEKFTKDTIISSGRLVPWKGFDILIKAIFKINANLLIVGDGEDKKRLEDLVLQNEVSDKVAFSGSLKEKNF